MTPRDTCSWLLVTLLLTLGSPLRHSGVVEGWGGLSPAPSESECRPYIEKALKEKELTPETPQEAVDTTDSERDLPPSQSADQEGSIEKTEEDITNESIDEKTSDEAHLESDGLSVEETTETIGSKEEKSLENTQEESVESPQGEESIESQEQEITGEEKKTEASLESEEQDTQKPFIQNESLSLEIGESIEPSSTEDIAAEQLSPETQDDNTKGEESKEEEKSVEESLEQTKEEDGELSSQDSEEVLENTHEVKEIEEKYSQEEISETEKTEEESTEKVDISENSSIPEEEQVAQESDESPGGEVTDSHEAIDFVDTKDFIETLKHVDTTAETKESGEERSEIDEPSKEDTKEEQTDSSSLEEIQLTKEVTLETSGELKNESSEESKKSEPEQLEDSVQESIELGTTDKIEATPTEVESEEKGEEVQRESTGESTTEQEPAVAEEVVKEPEPTVEDQLTLEFETPKVRRQREHIAEILNLTPESAETELLLAKTIETTLKDLKKLYDIAIKPLEILYKYRDLSNRHFGDPEIFSKPLILFMGPWSGGKSTILNYLLDNEFKSSSLRTGAEPSPAYFNLLMWGEREEVMDGTQLAADWTFSGLQKFGQGLLDRLRGLRLNAPLLEKVNIVEIPGILEIRKQVERLFPFNDACQWFIDRADIIFLVYDPSKLDVGPETEAILDQLKGREYQTRIILNKADQVKPEELMRVQGTLIWNISPLMSSQEPPVMYSTSLWSIPYEQGAPSRLLHAQERAFLRDLRQAIDKRVENKIASARRFAVRVRNHAKMVDCYLTTYYNHKTFFGNRKKVADDIIEHPQNYHIYEGLSTLTNISRYDLPDPEVYRDFFKLNPLYDFQRLSDTCTYFRGCPINRLDVAIAYDLPELVGKWKKQAERVLEAATEKQGKS